MILSLFLVFNLFSVEKSYSYGAVGDFSCGDFLANVENVYLKILVFKMKKILVSLFFVFLSPSIVNACWFDSLFGKSYSYNVLFYMPSGEEKFLGNAKSISSCQNMAGYEANRLSVPMSYLCCKTDGKSFCISKHK